jgi:hypothetical protein
VSSRPGTLPAIRSPGDIRLSQDPLWQHRYIFTYYRNRKALILPEECAEPQTAQAHYVQQSVRFHFRKVRQLNIAERIETIRSHQHTCCVSKEMAVYQYGRSNNLPIKVTSWNHSFSSHYPSSRFFKEIRTSSSLWAQQSRFHLQTGTKSILRNVISMWTMCIMSRNTMVVLMYHHHKHIQYIREALTSWARSGDVMCFL